MAYSEEPQGGSKLGVLGDDAGTQNLRQIGNPENRITEVKARAAPQTTDMPWTRQIHLAFSGKKSNHLKAPVRATEDQWETLIDEDLEESFLASDPPQRYARHLIRRAR